MKMHKLIDRNPQITKPYMYAKTNIQAYNKVKRKYNENTTNCYQFYAKLT